MPGGSPIGIRRKGPGSSAESGACDEVCGEEPERGSEDGSGAREGEHVAEGGAAGDAGRFHAVVSASPRPGIDHPHLRSSSERRPRGDIDAMNRPVDHEFPAEPPRRSRLALAALYCVLVPLSVLFVGTMVGVGMPGVYLALVGLPLGLVLGLVVLVRNAVSPGHAGSGLAILAVILSSSAMGLAYWFVSAMASAFHGRVLRIRGRAVLTPVRRLGRPPVTTELPLLGALARSDRAALTAHWTLAAREEHTSIAAFERLALALQARGAPRSLIDGAHTAARQEADHAARCFALASAFAGHTLVPGPLGIADAPTPTLVFRIW
jgi:hypothetical protein